MIILSRVCMSHDCHATFPAPSLLLNGLDTLPSTTKPFLPQTDPVVASADGQGVAAQAPAYAPCGGIDIQLGTLPLAAQIRRRPDDDGLVLRGRGNVRLGEDSGRPCNIAYPIQVTTREYVHVLPAATLWAELPDLDLAVASTSHQSPCRSSLVGARTNNLPRCNSGGPGYAVHATAMSLEELMCPVVVLEFQYRDIAVSGCASEQAACLVGCPGDKVDRGSVEGDLVDLLPAVGLLAPDEDLAVVRRRREDVAVLWVCPCDAPDSALVSVGMSVGNSSCVGGPPFLLGSSAGYDVPSECLYQCMFLAFYLEDLDRLVRRAGR